MIIWVISDDTSLALTDDEQGFFADAFDGYELEASSTKSRHPIAKDANKSDHISLDPLRLRLEGCIGSKAFAKGVDIFSGTTDRTGAACDLLIEMWRSKQCVKIVVKGKTFEDFAIMGSPIKCTNDGRLTFTLQLEQFEYYDTSEVFEATIGRKVDLGEVATTSGEPSVFPAGTPFDGVFPDGIPRADIFDANVNSFFECAQGCETASSVICLDACYANEIAL